MILKILKTKKSKRRKSTESPTIQRQQLDNTFKAFSFSSFVHRFVFCLHTIVCILYILLFS